MFDETQKSINLKNRFCLTFQMDIWCKHLMVVSMKKSLDLKVCSCIIERFFSLIGIFDNRTLKPSPLKDKGICSLNIAGFQIRKHNKKRFSNK